MKKSNREGRSIDVLMGLKKYVVQIVNRGRAGLFYLLTIDCPTGRLCVLFQRLYQFNEVVPNQQRDKTNLVQDRSRIGI